MVQNKTYLDLDTSHDILYYLVINYTVYSFHTQICITCLTDITSTLITKAKYRIRLNYIEAPPAFMYLFTFLLFCLMSIHLLYFARLHGLGPAQTTN